MSINFLKRLWGDERGQSTTEYILILAVVVVVAVKFKSKFTKSMTTMMDSLDKSMNDANQGLEP